jgi:hypothetical protein
MPAHSKTLLQHIQQTGVQPAIHEELRTEYYLMEIKWRFVVRRDLARPAAVICSKQTLLNITYPTLPTRHYALAFTLRHHWYCAQSPVTLDLNPVIWHCTPFAERLRVRFDWLLRMRANMIRIFLTALSM